MILSPIIIVSIIIVIAAVGGALTYKAFEKWIGHKKSVAGWKRQVILNFVWLKRKMDCLPPSDELKN